MREIHLTASMRQALLALLLISEEPATNSMLHDRFGLKISKDSRDQLVAAKFITTWKGAHRAYHHLLTDSGRDRAIDELGKDAPPGTSTGVRLFYAMANVLDRTINDHGLKATEIFSRDTTPSASVEDQIISAYERLAKRGGELVSLVRLRGELSAVPRDVMDRTLKSMDRHRAIHLDPDPNTKALPPEAHTAAIRLGGEDKHFITIGSR